MLYINSKGKYIKMNMNTRNNNIMNNMSVERMAN